MTIENKLWDRFFYYDDEAQRVLQSLRPDKSELRKASLKAKHAVLECIGILRGLDPYKQEEWNSADGTFFAIDDRWIALSEEAYDRYLSRNGA